MNKTMKHTMVAAAIAAATLAASGAQAATATANLTVQAQVTANCTISTAVVDFGSYDPVVANASAAKTGNGSVTVACTKGSAPTIGLGLGSNSSGSTRRMTNGTDMLIYELYLPPNTTPGTACGALTTVWGTSGANLFTPTSPASSAGRTYNVCGSVAGGQNVGVGSYSDTVVATVTF
jgi:spore coat protein U-like protein